MAEDKEFRHASLRYVDGKLVYEQDPVPVEGGDKEVWIDCERVFWADANPVVLRDFVPMPPGSITVLDEAGTIELPTDEHRADEVWLPEPDDRPEQVAAALTSWLDLARESGWSVDDAALQALVDAVERYRCYRKGPRS